MINQELVCNKFNYNIITGILTWKNSRFKNKIGTEAGSVSGHYRSVFVDGQDYGVHRVIYLMMEGYMPPMVDHINGDKLFNCWINLRSSDNQKNQENQQVHRDGKSPGIHRSGNGFSATYMGGYIGYFSTEQEAIEARDEYKDSINVE